ncbi:ribosome maturation factor RimM [Ahrensia sp. R2A130]|uniref:ribosome maturation factor RimM n=1 Tax=Ahrensia sp. R2A130 TaxID=744979 RepID=UPI0001E09437|nr:ribosome maturation factor RimM [Ahrensia sp. R2A130]EFL89562.1 16S rRNA processing protein RimM [Ahrensia sp. R2A130]
MTDPSSLILLAQIGRPQGIKGELRVKAFTDNPEALDDYGALRTADGRRFKVKRMRPGKGVLIVKFEGVNTREEAEAENGTELFIERHRLPPVEDEDEFYVTDLIGMVVVDGEGLQIGTVKDAPDFGAGSVLEITGGAGSVMVDFTHANVPDVDLAAGRVTVIMPAELVTDENDGEEDEIGEGS